jgi:hypothetical protein
MLAMEGEDHHLNHFSCFFYSLYYLLIIIFLKIYRFIYFHHLISYHLSFLLAVFIFNYLIYSYLQFIQQFCLRQFLPKLIGQGHSLQVLGEKTMFFLLGQEVEVLHLNQIVITMMIKICLFWVYFYLINFLLRATHQLTIPQFYHYYFVIKSKVRDLQLLILAIQMAIIFWKEVREVILNQSQNYQMIIPQFSFFPFTLPTIACLQFILKFSHFTH